MACFVGGAIGALLYFFCIEVHHPAESEAAVAGLELRAVPEAAKGIRPPAPEQGHHNGAFRDEDGYPRAGGHRRDSRQDRGAGYPREPSYPREPNYPRDDAYRGDRYM